MESEKKYLAECGSTVAIIQS